jgi:hypothetical protein
MKEELTHLFWVPFSPWLTVFGLAIVGVILGALIAFTFGKVTIRTVILLIPVVIVVGFFAIHAMNILAGGRAARLAAVLDLPDAEMQIQPVTIQSKRFVSISSYTADKGLVVPANKVMLSTDEVAPVATIYKKFHPERTAFNGLGSSGLAPKN